MKCNCVFQTAVLVRVAQEKLNGIFYMSWKRIFERSSALEASERSIAVSISLSQAKRPYIGISISWKCALLIPGYQIGIIIPTKVVIDFWAVLFKTGKTVVSNGKIFIEVLIAAYQLTADSLHVRLRLANAMRPILTPEALTHDTLNSILNSWSVIGNIHTIVKHREVSWHHRTV